MIIPLRQRDYSDGQIMGSYGPGSCHGLYNRPRDRFIVLDNNGILQPAHPGTGLPLRSMRQPRIPVIMPTPPSAPGHRAPSPPTPPSITFMAWITAAGAHRMPFNRVDYYLDNNSQFPNAKQLRRRHLHPVSKHDQTRRPASSITTPLVDCVRDFQVAFGLDTSSDNNINSWATKSGHV